LTDTDALATVGSALNLVIIKTTAASQFFS
jgi:hypothetical protein